MTKKIFKKFANPFPYSQGLILEAKKALIICVMIIIIISILSPSLYKMLSFTNLLGFGIATLFSVLFNLFSSLFLFRRFINEEKWVVWKEIIKSLFYLYINAAAILYYGFILGIHIRFYSIMEFVFYVFVFSLIPISIRINSINVLLLKKHIKDVEKLNSIINKSSNIPSETSIVVKSNIVNETITTSSEELIFIKAEQNYIRFAIFKGQKIKQVLFRISLIKATDQLYDDLIIRCHRSYVVNLRFVEKIIGNSRDLKLVLKEGNEKIPVSQSYKNELVQKLSALQE